MVLIMDVKQFLDVLTWIHNCPHRRYLGINSQTHMNEYEWTTWDWIVGSQNQMIWHSNHMFRVLPGSYLTYRTIEICSSEFIVQLNCKSALWRWYHSSSLFANRRIKTPVDHSDYVLTWDGDLTEWNSVHTWIQLQS